MMTLEPMEFICRFSMHILPKAFVRIRHYGILSTTSKKEAIPLIKQQIPLKKINSKLHLAQQYNPRICPCCKTESMVIIELFTKRGPPFYPLPQNTAFDTDC